MKIRLALVTMKVEKFDSLLNSLYYDLKHPTAFTSLKNIHQAAKKINPNISKSDVNEWMKKQITATLHKPVRYKFPRNKTIVMSIADQYQSDLCDMSSLSKENDDFKFILTCIDCFSRYGWAIPIKNKSGSEISRVLQDIFSEKVCKRIQTDKGKEFLNHQVKKLLKKYNVELWISENDDIKASIVERFNRTLKTRMWKYFTSTNTRRYVDVLPSLVEGYNLTKHGSIKMKPADVRPEHEMKLRRILYGTKSIGKTYHGKTYKYKLNSTVRISKARRQFKKGYLPNWTEEIFTVVSKENKNRPVYKIKDFNGNIIEGKFYEEELQEVKTPDEFRIEKVIRKEKRGRKTFYLVKWLGYNNSFNSWVPESDLKRL